MIIESAKNVWWVIPVKFGMVRVKLSSVLYFSKSDLENNKCKRSCTVADLNVNVSSETVHELLFQVSHYIFDVNVESNMKICILGVRF